MQTVFAGVPDVVNATITAAIGDRVYGHAREADHLGSLWRMPVPAEMDRLRAMLEERSRLLALPQESGQEAIYDAFGSDLELLIRYRDAFKSTVDAAVRARAAADQAARPGPLRSLTRQISEVVFEPTLDLGPTAVALPVDALRRALQDQFRADAAAFVRSVAVWLHVLAECQFVSVIEWFNPRVVRYHFFRMDSERQEIERQRTVTGHAFNGRTITTTMRVRSDLFSERRVHTVVNAQIHAPKEYRQRVPRGIADLIDAIPAEVKPFVSIIDGTVSQEEIHRRLTESRVETTTRSVFIPDPALALFNSWAITGWGGSTPEKARSLYQGHPLSKAHKYLIAEAVGTVALTTLAGIAEGRRGAVVVFLICAILTAFQQFGMRITTSRS